MAERNKSKLEDPANVRVVVSELALVSINGGRWSIEGISRAKSICAVSKLICGCLARMEDRIARELTIPSGWITSLLGEVWRLVRGKVSAAVAFARAALRCVLTKVFGWLGKFLGYAVGVLFSPAGAIVGAAFGIALGCALARICMRVIAA